MKPMQRNYFYLHIVGILIGSNKIELTVKETIKAYFSRRHEEYEACRFQIQASDFIELPRPKQLELPAIYS
jgi:hypothetical protein